MIKNTIPGIETVFDTDIHPGSIVLVTGTPGTLKTGFTFSLMAEHLRGRNESGIYITLEETEESHIRNMRSVGMKVPKNLIVVDYTHLRKRDKETSRRMNAIHVVKKALEYFQKETSENYTIFALDSLGALYTLSDMEPEVRVRELYHLFETLRDMKLTSYIITEKSRFPSAPLNFGGHEAYFSDGIIEMGTIEAYQDIKIYMQVIKMRACAHSRRKFLIDVSEDGLSILGPTIE